MKPRALTAIVLGSVVVAAAHVAFGLLLMSNATSRPAARPLRAFNNRPFVGGVLAMPAAPAQEVGQACTPEQVAAQRGAVVAARDSKVSGPITHGNLSVYLIHGPDRLRGGRVLPLQTALAQGLATVHAAGLSIDNRADVPIFVQAGDVVKGGTQDRTIPYDQLVPPGAIRQPLQVFCVEAGRSSPRAGEVSTSFEVASQQLPGRRLNLAARQYRSQAEVWEGVRALQADLARSVGASVQSPLSQTSLQLTLEHPQVERAVGGYVDALFGAAGPDDDVIGVVVAINGRVQSAEVYASSALFRDLWPKLLRANAVAALAERPRAGDVTAPSVEQVRQFLADAEAGTDCRQDRINGTVVLRQEAAGTLLFDTCDPTRANLVIHRSILTK